MAKKIEKLTKEQESYLPEFREKWLQIGLCTKTADRPRAETAITKMYELINKKKPMFFWFDSPLQCNLAINFLKNWKMIEKDLKGNLRDNLWGNLRDNLWGQFKKFRWKFFLGSTRSLLDRLL